MGNMADLKGILQMGEEIGGVKEAHLYENGMVSVSGDDFTITFMRKEEDHGRAQDVCKDDHRFRCLS